ncbi:MAG TPA: hypothetical protein VH595_22030 [Verrucomicrobiae bacterium]|nr:hypothetical protein [Verrucomicrobiae bacterium]
MNPFSNIARQHSNGFATPKIEKTPEAEKVIAVEVTEKTGCCLDGERTPHGQKIKISVKQWRALSRHFKFVDGPAHHAPEGWTEPAKPAPAS